MFTFTIQSAGCYTRQECHVQTVGSPWLIFSASGLTYQRVYHPDGSLLCETETGFTGFGLRTPGMVIDFGYGPGRENWVVMFNGLELELTENGLVLGNSPQRVPVPLSVPVEPTELPRWQELFKRLCWRVNNPLPRNLLLARMDAMEVLRHIMEYGTATDPSASPVIRFKQLMDKDVSMVRTLADISGECGYSTDHLRIMFTRRFGISPGQYRQRQRLGRVMEFISHGAMNVNEIAAAAGFRHSSHLCKAFKEIYGITPAEGIRRYRYGSK